MKRLRRYRPFIPILLVLIVTFATTFITTSNVGAVPTCMMTCYVATTGNDANSGTTPGTALRNIQTAVDQVSSGGTVNIADGTYTENVVVPGGKNVTIDGGGSGLILGTVVDGGDAGNVFSISGGTVTLSDMRIRDGAPSGFDQGNGVFSEFANLTLLRVVITSNNGNGVYSNLGNDLTVTNSTISNNSGFTGGGIRQEVGGDLIVTGSTISGNTATTLGGGIYLSRASSASISRSTISGNSADIGAGIFNANTDPLTISNSTISGNTATTKGGGIGNINDGDSDCSNCSSITTIINSTIASNTAATGAGIQNESIFGG
ncbi:MAG: right-handed parallel beta-helix repeat-containing protein, partial [Chloroflexota bacterium]|nr:right-handed parallel beta-helix repeat-containing protein [Chloroflexota bacterium]